MKKFQPGQKVRFTPRDLKNWTDFYTPDGVVPGAEGVVVSNNFDDDVLVDFTRPDGTVCKGFLAFIADVEAIDVV